MVTTIETLVLLGLFLTFAFFYIERYDLMDAKGKRFLMVLASLLFATSVIFIIRNVFFSYFEYLGPLLP